MKLKLIHHKPIVREDPPQIPPDKPPLTPSDAPMEEKREALYQAVERAQRFMHSHQPQDEVIAGIRRLYPAPKYFLESNRQAMTRTGLSSLDAFYYAMIPALTRTALSQQWGMTPKLDTLSRMSAFLRTFYVGVHEEQFYLVLLNGRGKLIRAAMLQKGAIDSAPFYLNQLLSTALSEGAKYMVLSHNHPRGTRRPSREDLACTLRTLNAVAPLGIPLLDHIIVVRDGAVSIRESGLIPAILWTPPTQNTPIVRNWLDVEMLRD